MRPSLWICQCMNVVRRSTTCIRYMPTLRVPVRGSRVITAGSVMKGAGSPGQQCWMGSSARSISSPVSTTSWHGPERTLRGIESAIDFSFFSPFTFSTSPCGGCISSTSSSLRPTASRLGSPNARHILRSVPNWLISSGCCEPFGCSKRSAGPPALTVRSVISVISRRGSTSAVTRTRSPSRSRSAIQSRRSPAGFTASSLVRSLVAAVAQPAEELAEPDHADEDQADDQHAGDDVPPLGGGVGEHGEHGEHGATLADAERVRGEGALDRLCPGGSPRGILERGRIALQAKRLAGLFERSRAEQRRGRRPGSAVAACTVRAQLSAQRDQLSEVGDRDHVLALGHADEAVRVKIVTEQEGGLAAVRREESRPSVVE